MSPPRLKKELRFDPDFDMPDSLAHASAISQRPSTRPNPAYKNEDCEDYFSLKINREISSPPSPFNVAVKLEGSLTRRNLTPNQLKQVKDLNQSVIDDFHGAQCNVLARNTLFNKYAISDDIPAFKSTNPTPFDSPDNLDSKPRSNASQKHKKRHSTGNVDIPLPIPTPFTSRSLSALKDALSVIQSQLSEMHETIATNIELQKKRKKIEVETDKTITESTIDVLDERSLPCYKPKDRDEPGAILATVQMACLVERGLEALIKVLELGRGEEWQGRGFMKACNSMPRTSGDEMRSALRGIEGVLKSAKEAVKQAEKEEEDDSGVRARI